jgi:hypothetical protein
LILPARRSDYSLSFTNLDVCSLVCLAAVGLSFIATSEYDSHYGGFIAPFLALVLSAVMIRMLPLTNLVVRVCFVIALLGYFVITDHSFIDTKYPGVPTAVIDRTFSPSTCVLSQTYSPLLLSDQFNLFRTGCPRALDIYGTELTDGKGMANRATDGRVPKLQLDWLSWLHRAGGIVLLSPLTSDPNLGRVARAYFHEHFSLVGNFDTLYIYKRH